MAVLQVHPVPAHGAEDVLVATHGPDEGAVFTGTADGSVWRLTHDGRRLDLVAHTGGRPLGLEELRDGRLLVCDAHRGVLALDPATVRTEVLVRDVEGVPMRFCNNAAVADDQTIWFTDSSRRHGIEEWRDDFIEHTRTGRLLRRDPDGGVETVLDGLSFGNGVALASDGSFVAVAETRSRNVLRWWVTGDRAGTRDELVTDLPGYPDNISRGSDGLIWVTIASPRDAVAELIDRAPAGVRRAVARVPERLQPQVRRTVRVQAYDDGGRLVHDLDLPADGYHMVTGVREHEGRVWMGSLEEPAVAVAEVPQPAARA